MRVILAACLALSLAGCVLKKGPKTVAATPVAPKPVPAPPTPPPPPPEPLSIRQTNIDLPAAQPISAEALNTTQLPEETVTPAPTPSRGRRPRGGSPAAAAAKPEAPRAEAPKPEPAKTEAAAPAPPPAPPIRAIVPAEEQQQFKQRADEVRRETQQRIAHVRGHGLEIDRISGLLKLSADAESRGELRQAYELADRALVLAKELTGGK